MFAFTLENPVFCLCLPPVVFLLQFLAWVGLFAAGFPDHQAEHGLKFSLLVILLFSLILPIMVGIGLSVRQIFLHKNKILCAFNLLFNGFYLFAFVSFFIAYFVVHATN